MNPIRWYVRRGEFGIPPNLSVLDDSIVRNWPSSKLAVMDKARLWSSFSFDVSNLSDLDQGQNLDFKDLGDCRLPYQSLWLEAGPWAAYLQSDDEEGGKILAIFFCRARDGGIGYFGYCAISLDLSGRLGKLQAVNNHQQLEDLHALTYFALAVVGLINSKRVEIHYRGEILKERVPPAPTCPIKMSVMPTVRLKEGVSLKFESGKGRGEPCQRGRRWHCVMSHPRWITRKETGKKEQVRVKSHWRGNKDLGTVRPEYLVN